MISRRILLGGFAAAVLSGCGGSRERNLAERPLAGGAGSEELRGLISHYAKHYDVPVTLVHRVVQRESRYNPAARNGPYFGLMQMLPATARTMGYRGAPEGLLDAETNLRYGVKYLRGAWLVSDGSHDRAVGWYARGYYYEAKKRGLLRETGLRS